MTEQQQRALRTFLAGRADDGPPAARAATPRRTIPATLAGRSMRATGHVVHAVPSPDGRDVAHCAYSLCGRTHGARSAGWAPMPGQAITCLRCAAEHAALERARGAQLELDV